MVPLVAGSLPEACQPLHQLRGQLHVLQSDRRFFGGSNAWIGNLGLDNPQELDNLRAEHGISSNDATHRLTTAFIVDLPIGKGRWIGRDLHGVLDGIVGGWSLNSFLTIQSGQPLAIIMSDNRLGDGNQRPNVVCDQMRTGMSYREAAQSGDPLPQSGLLRRPRRQHPRQCSPPLLQFAGGRNPQSGPFPVQRIHHSGGHAASGAGRNVQCGEPSALCLSRHLFRRRQFRDRHFHHWQLPQDAIRSAFPILRGEIPAACRGRRELNPKPRKIHRSIAWIVGPFSARLAPRHCSPLPRPRYAPTSPFTTSTSMTSAAGRPSQTPSPGTIRSGPVSQLERRNDIDSLLGSSPELWHGPHHLRLRRGWSPREAGAVSCRLHRRFGQTAAGHEALHTSQLERCSAASGQAGSMRTPGALRISVLGPDGKVISSGSLDPGYPLPGKIRQAKLPLPKGMDWKGLRIKAEIEVKGLRYPVRWACQQRLNDDGSLTLRPTAGLGQDDTTGGVPPA